MHIFFSVGEPSGDQHAAHLIHELKGRRADIEISGYGGPAMEQAGCRLRFQLTDLAVMGFLRVIPLLWKFYSLVKQAERVFRESPPDAVVLVDFPGFNWWIARKAKAAGIPVFYYMPPQLWAWAAWRIKRVKRFVDHVLCALPFEYAWYAERGVNAHYVAIRFRRSRRPYARQRFRARMVVGNAPERRSPTRLLEPRDPSQLAVDGPNHATRLQTPSERPIPRRLLQGFS